MGSELKKLVGQTAIYGTSTILARIINFFLVPLYTRVLTQADYGVLTEFMAYVAIFQVVLTMGLETGCFRFANKEGVNSNTVFSNALGIVSFVSLFFLLAIILFGEPLSVKMGYEGYYNCFIYIGVILAIDAFTAILFVKLRNEDRAVKFAAFKTVKILSETLFNLLFFLLLPALFLRNPDSFMSRFVSTTPDFTYAIFAIFLSCILTLLLFIPDILRIKFRPDRKLMKQMLLYSLPLMIAGLPGIMNDFMDRILFRFFNTDLTIWREDLGIYQAAAKLAVIMSLFIQMFRYAAEPFFFSKAKEKNSRTLYAQVMEYFVAFCMLIFLGITLYMDLIELILGRDFRVGVGVVPILLMAYVLLGMLFNVSMWYKLSDKSGYAIWITLAGLVVTIAINVGFMPLYSYKAAAWGHFFSYLVMLIISILLGNKYYPIPYRWTRILRSIAMALIIYGISFLLPELSLWPKLIIHSGLILLYIFVWIIVEKIDIKSLIKKRYES